jgi:hypothetical protein
MACAGCERRKKKLLEAAAKVKAVLRPKRNEAPANPERVVSDKDVPPIS